MTDFYTVLSYIDGKEVEHDEWEKLNTAIEWAEKYVYDYEHDKAIIYNPDGSIYDEILKENFEIFY